MRIAFCETRVPVVTRGGEAHVGEPVRELRETLLGTDGTGG